MAKTYYPICLLSRLSLDDGSDNHSISKPPLFSSTMFIYVHIVVTVGLSYSILFTFMGSTGLGIFILLLWGKIRGLFQLEYRFVFGTVCTKSLF